MIFTAPIWLFALAAISIPVVIHLWNIKPGKTLKVGSIALFSESSPKSSRSFKLQDILLLILRCLSLALLAFLLAYPLWQQHLKAGKAKGWLLIPKEAFNQTYRHFKPLIDPAYQHGYELHYFNNGFAKADLKEISLHPFADTITAQPANYWDLVKQLQHRIPSSVKAKIFTPNTINHFRGNKPETNLDINWQTYTPTDSVSVWLAGAWLTANGYIRVVQGTATPNGTSYQYNDIKNGGQTSVYDVTLQGGLPLVSIKTDPNSKIAVDNSTQRMAIYADKNNSDADYLKAALTAIAQLTQRKTIIKTYYSADAIPAGQDQLFWLSEKPAGNTIAQKTNNLFKYETGKVSEVTSWLTNGGDNSLMQGQKRIPLTKVIIAKTIGSPVWVDGFGRPVLSREVSDKVNTYHFYSRFNPAWGDLVWTDEFPKWMLTLMNDQHYAVGMHERRAVSSEQLKLAQANTTEQTVYQPQNTTDLTKYLWLVLVLVLLIERWLATKNKLIPANG